MGIKRRKAKGSTTFHVVTHAVVVVSAANVTHAVVVVSAANVTHAVVVVSAANVTWKTFVRIKYQQNI